MMIEDCSESIDDKKEEETQNDYQRSIDVRNSGSFFTHQAVPVAVRPKRALFVHEGVIAAQAFVYLCDYYSSIHGIQGQV